MATAQTVEIIANYKEFSKAMFAEDSPYQLAKKELLDIFDSFGLVNAEHGQVLAQTLAQMATSANSTAMQTAQTTLTVSKDVALKEAQTGLVTRQNKGYDDNLLVKVTEFQSGITQYAVNAGDPANIQQAVSLNNAKIAQVEGRVEGFTPVIPDVEVYGAPASVAIASTVAGEIQVSWLVVAGLPVGTTVDEYNVYIDGVLEATTTELSQTITGLTSGTKYAVTVSAKVNTIPTRISVVQTVVVV